MDEANQRGDLLSCNAVTDREIAANTNHEYIKYRPQSALSAIDESQDVLWQPVRIFLHRV